MTIVCFNAFLGQSCCGWPKPNCPSCCCHTRPHSHCGGASPSEANVNAMNNHHVTPLHALLTTRDTMDIPTDTSWRFTNRLWLNAYNMKHEALPYRNSGAWLAGRSMMGNGIRDIPCTFSSPSPSKVMEAERYTFKIPLQIMLMPTVCDNYWWSLTSF